MSQQVQELINKIKSEGIASAEQKAAEIEKDAREQAEQILEKAQAASQKIIAEAQSEAKKLQERTNIALQQAARDAILALRKEIETTLFRIVKADVGHSLTAEHLDEILSTIIANFVKDKSGQEDIKVLLSASDLKKLKDGSIKKLQEKLKHHPVTLQASGDIAKGFTISFDQGKSGFEFSDKSLAEYISTYLNPEVAMLLKTAVASSKK